MSNGRNCFTGFRENNSFGGTNLNGTIVITLQNSERALDMLKYEFPGNRFEFVWKTL